jgi:Flp pilus assembly CpaF family ATPase
LAIQVPLSQRRTVRSSAPYLRIVILEDTAEIQCAAENAVALHTSDAAGLARLLKTTMRLRPDRIIAGEVRDGALR